MNLDLVAAYKKLTAEKERLEDTLKTVTTSVESSANDDKIQENTESEVIIFLISYLYALHPYVSKLNRGLSLQTEVHELRSKINKLVQSLSALSNEKRAIEEQYQNERKQLIHQNHQLEEKLKNLSSSVGNSKKIQEVEVENVKSQLNVESHQRELEFASTIRLI